MEVNTRLTIAFLRSPTFSNLQIYPSTIRLWMHSTLNPLFRTPQRTLRPLPSSAKLCAYIAAPINIKFLPKLFNLF
jgi:hypothetical protein